MLYREATPPSRASLSDENLIQRYKYTDDKDAFAELYHRYRHLVFGVCLKYLANHNDSEDMTSLVFEKLLTKPPGEEVESFKAWLYKITVNECLGGVRKEQTRSKVEENFKNLEERSQKFMENEGFARLISKGLPKGPEHDLEDLIEKLPKEQKQCLKLFYVKRLRYKAIATKLDIDERKVKSALQNGKRNLKMLFLKMNAVEKEE